MIAFIYLIITYVLETLDKHQLLVLLQALHGIIEVVSIILKIIQCICNKMTNETLFLISVFIIPFIKGRIK